MDIKPYLQLPAPFGPLVAAGILANMGESRAPAALDTATDRI